MARLLVAVLVDENGLLAAGLHDPPTAAGSAPDLHASAVVAGCFVCPLASAKPWLAGIAMARLLVEVLVDENGLLAADLRELATGSALAVDLLGAALAARYCMSFSLLLSRGWPG
jgi:hypothetical protein